MSTLKELIEKHGLPVRVVSKATHCRNSNYFEAIGISKDKETVIGFYSEGVHDYFDSDFSNEWSLFVEPKQKVKRWLWANEDGDICLQMYVDAPKLYSIKLLWSETEFEE